MGWMRSVEERGGRRGDPMALSGAAGRVELSFPKRRKTA